VWDRGNISESDAARRRSAPLVGEVKSRRGGKTWLTVNPHAARKGLNILGKTKSAPMGLNMDDSGTLETHFEDKDRGDKVEDPPPKKKKNQQNPEGERGTKRTGPDPGTGKSIFLKNARKDMGDLGFVGRGI